ncbi:unnamed protein product [Caenorhabditis brenneri]
MMNPSSTSVQKKPVNAQVVTEPVRTRMQLLKLPLLVQLEILKTMRYTDIFTMSLCSSRMYNLIKACKIKVPRLCYKEYKNGFWVYNRLDENTDEYIVFVSAVQKYKHDKDQMRAIYGGVRVDFQWRPWGIEYIDEDYGPIQRMTQNHINGLFHLSDIDLELCRENLEQGYYPDIRNVTDILVTLDSVQSNTLHEILQMHPNVKSLKIREIDGVVPADSILFKIEEVALHGSFRFLPTFLDNFSGRRAYLTYLTGISARDIINCVTDWISGRKLHNLSMLYMGVGLNDNIVLFSLRPLAKNIVMPDTYEGSFRFIGSRRIGSHEWQGSDEQFLHFERETDQKIATLVYSESSSTLLVWD